MRAHFAAHGAAQRCARGPIRAPPPHLRARRWGQTPQPWRHGSAAAARAARSRCVPLRGAHSLQSRAPPPLHLERRSPERRAAAQAAGHWCSLSVPAPSLAPGGRWLNSTTRWSRSSAWRRLQSPERPVQWPNGFCITLAKNQYQTAAMAAPPRDDLGFNMDDGESLDQVGSPPPPGDSCGVMQRALTPPGRPPPRSCCWRTTR